MIPHMMEHSTISSQQQPNQQPPPPPSSSSLTHGNVMPPQMNAQSAAVAGAPGPMAGPKSGIPPNLPPPQMPPANASASSQIQQVMLTYFCAKSNNKEISFYELKNLIEARKNLHVCKKISHLTAFSRTINY